MKRREVIAGLAFSTSLLTAIASGCANQSDQQASSEAGTTKRTLKMATDANYPPYEFYETAGGSQEPLGFDIDIARYITSKLGYGLQITSMDFSGVIPAIQASRVDFAMAGITPTAERQKSVDFSDIYYLAKDVFVVKKDGSLQSFEALAGKTVGVKLGTTQEQAAKQMATELQGLNSTSLNDLGAVIQEIKSGRVDAGLMEEAVAKEYLVSNPDLDYFAAPEKYLGNPETAGAAIAFPKGSPLREEFAPVLQEMKTNGELDKLTKKWFEDYYQQRANKQG